MKTYELTYMTANEESISASSVSDTLAEHKASITSVHLWGGRRKLAYPIKKQDQAFYTTVIFEGEPSTIAPITHDLQLNTTILRTLIVDFVPGFFHRAPSTSEDRESTKTPAAAPTPSVESPVATISDVTPEAVTVPAAPAEEVVTQATEEKPKRKRAVKAASTEETKALDEKLDALLNEDITK